MISTNIFDPANIGAVFFTLNYGDAEAKIVGSYLLCWPELIVGTVRGRARVLTRRIFGG